MHSLTGVYKLVTKSGNISYRASLTYRGRHISLGSFLCENEAHLAYTEARELLSSKSSVLDFEDTPSVLSFDKWVCLVNFRDNGVYIKNPIYLHRGFFSYFLSPACELKFDNDDLFFYSEHKIQRRGGHLFCENYGNQLSLKSRYGIPPFAVAGRDFRFINGDQSDYRYRNIEVINHYRGVRRIPNGRGFIYAAVMHVRGDWILGRFSSEEEAAIAFNKALDMLSRAGHKKRTVSANFVENMPASKYAAIYTKIELSAKFVSYINEISS